MTHRLIIVPRWAGHATSDWYPWLTQELADAPGFASIEALELPTPQAPTIDAWTQGISRALGDDRATLAQTIVVGHSVGCRALLHALSRLPGGARVAGTLLVAAWWTVDSPWPTILPWIEAPVDLERVKAASPPPHVLLSDNDPFTADHQETARRFAGALGASVEVIPGAKHFNASAEPAVLRALVDRYAGA